MKRRTACAWIVLASSLALAAPAQAALTISDAPTSNVTCSGSVCFATAADAVLNVKALRRALNTADMKVESGSVAADIVVAAKLNWAKPTRLTLDSYRSIAVAKDITVEGAGGALTLTTNDGGSGGDYTFAGKLTFLDLSSSLVINGQTFTLMDSLNRLQRAVKANPEGSFALDRDLDESAKLYKQSPVHSAFDGIFEGLGHKIDRLSITGSRGGCLGLFRFLEQGAVRDLDIPNATVKTRRPRTRVGVAMGCGGGDLLYVTASGTVTANEGKSTAGGLAGLAGTIFHASAAVDVVGTAFTGGLVGEATGFVTFCHASGNVTGSGEATGGLVGIGGGINFSSASGNVTGAAGRLAYTGGLVGNGGGIFQSWASGAVSAGHDAKIGALVGRGAGINDSYATGSVSGAAGGTGAAGGLVGEGYDAHLSYSTGAVTGGPKARHGGFVGQDDDVGFLSDTYWDLETSGIANPARGAGNVVNDPGVTGLTTAQFQSGLPSGFDTSVWAQNGAVNNGFPYLISNPPR